MILLAQRRLDAAGCAIVTASHSPAGINGLKWMVGDLPPGPEEVQRLGRQAAQPEAADGPSGDSPRPLDISFDYVAWLQETWADSLRPRGTWSSTPCTAAGRHGHRRYLTAIFPECLFSAVHDWRDPEFDGQSPIARIPIACTSSAKRSIAIMPIWESPSTATGIAWLSSTTREWP